MNSKFFIPVITSILILGTVGLSYDVFAVPGENNGNNGCEKSNPNSKACEKNPNANPDDDGDGIPNNSDLCPSEDATGYDVNGDGCIDDTDGDSILDPNDNCPNISNSNQDDTDSDGLGDACDAFPVDVLIINEMLPNPTVIPDADGEWFEVYNPTNQNINMNGWTISDGEGSHTVSSLFVVGPGDYAILAYNGNQILNGGVNGAYEYGIGDGSTIKLANGGDNISIFNPSGDLVDRVQYGSSINGKSWELSINAQDVSQNDFTTSNWCHGVSPFGIGDLGTPGSVNDCALLPPNPTPGI